MLCVWTFHYDCSVHSKPPHLKHSFKLQSPAQTCVGCLHSPTCCICPNGFCLCIFLLCLLESSRVFKGFLDRASLLLPGLIFPSPLSHLSASTVAFSVVYNHTLLTCVISLQAQQMPKARNNWYSWSAPPHKHPVHALHILNLNIF